MATVIRAARIGSEQVTLPTRSRAADPAPPVPPRRESGQPAPPPPEAQAPARSAPADDPAAILSAALAQREQRLADREREFQDELEAERGRVSEQAYSAGLERGEQAGARAHAERLDALARLIASLKTQFASEIAGLEDVVVGIAYEAVCKIVGDAMTGSDGVRAVVRTVMDKVKDQEQLVLHVAPRDYRLLEQHRDQLFGEGQGGKHELVPDDRVVLGGCLIETAGGTIDGRLEIQLQRLREALIGARKMIPE